MTNLDLQDATALTIGFTLDDERHEFRLSEPEPVRGLLAAIHVTGTEPGAQIGKDPFGWVNFHLPDGSAIKTVFINATQLDRAYWGQIYLQESFYQAICRAASQHAGRPIDVLKNNR
jgi:hypothetical protein